MDRASDSGSEGWGFESLPACHVGANVISFAPTFFKSQSARILLLLLSKSQPLRRIVIWWENGFQCIAAAWAYAGTNDIPFAPAFFKSQSARILLLPLRADCSAGPDRKPGRPRLRYPFAAAIWWEGQRSAFRPPSEEQLQSVLRGAPFRTTQRPPPPGCSSASAHGNRAFRQNSRRILF